MLVREESFEVCDPPTKEGFSLLLLGDSGVYESRFDTQGEAYRGFQKEHGRCVSRIYIDPTERHIGWVFHKREKYEDSSDTYLRETWVTLHSEMPEKRVDYHYMEAS